MGFGLDFSEQFTAQSKRLSKEIKAKLEKCLLHLSDNPRHPALRTHKVRNAQGFFSETVFEAYVDKKYRITWEYKDSGSLYLRNVDNHDECLKNP